MNLLDAVLLRRADEQCASDASAWRRDDAHDLWRIGSARKRSGPKPGQGRGRTKLSPAQVREIRRRLAESSRANEQTRIAREFGITPGAVSRIASGKTHKGVA